MSEIASTLARFLALASIQVLLLAIFAVAAIRLLRVRGTVACALLVAVMAIPLLSPLGTLLPAGARVEVPAGPLGGLVDRPMRTTAAGGESTEPPPPAAMPAPPAFNTLAESPAPIAPRPAQPTPDPTPSTYYTVGGAVSNTGGQAMGWRDLALLAWAAAVVLLTLRLVPAVGAHRRLVRRAHPVSDPRVIALLGKCAEEACAPTPRLLASRDPVVPFVTGIFRPMLLFPERLLARGRRDELRLAFLHELGHLRWRHALWIAPEFVLKTVFFFHPLLHWAVRRFREEREYVCDRLVTKVIGQRSPYAAFLLAELHHATRVRGVPSAALGTRSRMKQRLDRIIEERGPTMTGKITSLLVLGLAFTTFAGVLALAPATVRAEDKPGDSALEVAVAWTTPLDAPSFGESAVADVDGDGRLEVAFGTYFGDNSVRVLNGEDGSHYWRYDAVNACLDASLRFADLDGDGDLELVVPISNLGRVLALDLKRGVTDWQYTPQPVECTDSPPAILDIDEDGKPEVVYGTFAGKLHVIGHDGKRERVLQVCKGFIQTGPAILDIDGDGTLDYVCATFKSDNTIYAVSGKSGQPIWTFKLEGEHIGMYHGCSVGDLDGDGKPELTIGAYDGKIYCLEAATGKARWIAAPGDRFFMSPTVIADVTGDGKPEVLTASNRVSVISSDGKVLWSKPCAGGGWDSATRGVSVADLDGDRVPDLVTLSGAGLLKVHRGSDGKLLYELDAATLTKGRLWGSSHGVTIADLTGDGRLDLFFVVGGTQPKKHGLAICLTGFQGKGRGWYMLRHDIRNTGNTATTHDSVLLKHIEGLTPTDKPVMKTPNRRGERAEAKPRVTRPRVVKGDYTSAFDLATERGVPKEVMKAAIEANRVRATKESAERLEELGSPAFVALCILIETGHGGSYTDPLLRRTWQLGLEQLLLDLSERSDLPNYGAWTALKGLGAADTPRVRKYLLGRLGRERGPGLFYSAASALGQLREEKAIAPIGEQLMKFEVSWSGVERHLIWALQAMKAEAVKPVLIEYLRDSRAKCCLYALLALYQLDPEQAAKEGRQLMLVEGRLDENSRKYIERNYPQWKPE